MSVKSAKIAVNEAAAATAGNSEENSGMVDLDSLNKKQQLKEFKLTIKEIKASDTTKKKNAMEKFNRDVRYLLEGEALVPFIESLVPNKKTLEHCNLGLNNLLNFFDKINPSSSRKYCLEGINAIFQQQGNVHVLHAITDSIILEPEKKGKKKVEPEIEALMERIRIQAVAASARIAKTLMDDYQNSNESLKSFATIPSILKNSLQALNVALTKLQESSTSPYVQVAQNILQIILAVLTFDDLAIEEFLLWPNIFESLEIFFGIADLSLLTAQIYLFVSKSIGIEHVAHQGLVDKVVIAVEESVSKLLGNANAKDRNKGGKNQKDKDSSNAADSKLNDISLIFTCVNILIVLSNKKMPCISEENVTKLLKPFFLLSFSSEVRQSCNIANEQFIQIRLLFRDICILIGSFGLYNPELRQCTNTNGGLKLLVYLIRFSNDISRATLSSPRSEDNPDEKIFDSVNQMRHVLEKAILSLTTEDAGEFEPTETKRWLRSAPFQVDSSSLKLSIDLSPEPPKVPQSILADFIEMLSSDDKDIANRAMRIIFALLSANQSNLSATINELQLLTNLNNKVADFVTKACAGIQDLIENDPSSWKSVYPSFVLGPLEAFVCGISAAELLIGQLKEFLIIYADPVRIKALSNLVYYLGPNSRFGDKYDEVIININHPRDYDWYGNFQADNWDKIIIREQILDTFAAIAKADVTHRTVEGELPQLPCVPFPDYSSLAAEAGLLVYSLASNPTVSTLMYNTQFVCCDGGIFRTGKNETELELSERVCNSGLKLLQAIGASGVQSICVFFESLNNSADFTVLKELCEFLSPLVDENISSQLIEAFVWNAPLLYEFPESSSIRNISEIASNKKLWIYYIVVDTLLGIINHKAVSRLTASLIVQALAPLCKVDTIASPVQPAVIDIFSATFLSCGGAVAIAGAVGKFGPLKEDPEEAISFLSFVLGRGSDRENYWSDHAKNVAAAAAEEESKGKGKDKGKGKEAPKKDDKSKGKDTNKKKREDIKFPFEPDATHPDPNHGPNKTTWAQLLDSQFSLSHSYSPNARFFTACIQGGLVELASLAASLGMNVNLYDGYGLSGLMHAFFFQETNLVKVFIEHDGEIDALDHAGNPVIKYACFSVLSNMLDDAYQNEPASYCKIAGDVVNLDILLANRVDCNIRDKTDENFPAHFLIGQGSLLYRYGSKQFNIFSIRSQSLSSKITKELKEIQSNGADLNLFNGRGITPLHVASAMGDVQSVDFLLKSGCAANARDVCGNSTVHYITSYCPENSITIFDKLIKAGTLRPIQLPVYDDRRTGLSKDDKYLVDANAIIEKVINRTFTPSIVSQSRLKANEIIADSHRLGNPVTPTIMSLLGPRIDTLSVPSDDTIVAKLERRFSLFQHILKFYDKYDLKALLKVSNDGVNVLHALLVHYIDIFQAIPSSTTNQLIDIANKILDYLDVILKSEDLDVNQACPVSIPRLHLGLDWHVLHGAVISRSRQLCEKVLSHPYLELPSNFVHFVINTLTSQEEEITNFLLQWIMILPNASGLLNSEDASGHTPLHLALELKNLAAIRTLVACKFVEVNNREKSFGRTPFHEACIKGDLEIIGSFENGCDRLDYLLTDINGLSCIDEAIAQSNQKVLEFLLSTRQNDVIERILTLSQPSELVEDAQQSQPLSCLMRLEKENIELHDSLLQNESDSKQGLQEQVDRSDAILSSLLQYLSQKGDIIGRDSHFHDCFYEGVLYKNFLLRPQDDNQQQPDVATEAEAEERVERNQQFEEEESSNQLVPE